MNTKNFPELNFSRHARTRQAERGISDDSVRTVIQSGVKLETKDVITYIDQNFEVVCRVNDGKIITVIKNMHNVSCQLSERTIDKKKCLLVRAYKNNDSSAMCSLAEFYLKGELGKKDIKEAFNLFVRAANLSDCHAMCRISQLYEDGTLGTRNLELADLWMKKALDRKNKHALLEAGKKLLFEYQEKYAKSPNSSVEPVELKEKILRYLTEASEKIYTKATHQLGVIYEEGLLGEENISKAIKFYVKAAKLACSLSLKSLHRLTLQSKFNSVELEEILDDLSINLHVTNLRGTFYIGEDQLSGDYGFNSVRGLALLEKAALENFDTAIRVLAKCYRDGKGCIRDLKLAQYWFIKLKNLYYDSAKAGNLLSLWKLGKMYLNGEAGSIDLQKAERCFVKCAVESSDPDRIYNLGIFYWEGRLGNKPVYIGIKLIYKAIETWKCEANFGSENVLYKLGNAYYSIKNLKCAVDWLSQAPSYDLRARTLLAKIYLDKTACEKNIPRGLKILESIIVEHDISPVAAFESVNFIADQQIIFLLQDVAMRPVPNENSKQYIFQEFVIKILAEVYETGKLHRVNYYLAAKYYNQLVVDFKNIEAEKKLVWMHINKHLPQEYFFTVKNWVFKTHLLFNTNDIKWVDFKEYFLILSKLYQAGDILPLNEVEAKKLIDLFYLASYFNSTDKDNLDNLPRLDYNHRLQIVSKLVEITNYYKKSSPSLYKILSRKLGDIFYNNIVINQNIDESIYWYTESSDANDNLASFSLAKIYHYNKRDINSAIEWYSKSIKQGNKNALDVLLKIKQEGKHNHLLEFLNKYEHKPMVKKSELVNIKPFKNLKIYPKTSSEMYELGKSYLNSKDNQNILNASNWLRKSFEKGNIDAGVELYTMYKSKILGNNLEACAENIYSNLLRMCYFKLMELDLLKNQNGPTTTSSMKSIHSVLKISRTTELFNQDPAMLLNKMYNNFSKNFKNVISYRQKILLEFYLQHSVSNLEIM